MLDPAEFTVFSSPGSPEWEFHDAVRPLSGDLVLPKHRGTFFVGTPLRQILAARHIDVIVLTGIATDEGVQRTALEAQQRGLFPVVVEDTVGAFIDRLTGTSRTLHCQTGSRPRFSISANAAASSPRAPRLAEKGFRSIRTRRTS
jgi:nicotinamidase-related amidase